MRSHDRAEHRSLILWVVILMPAIAWFAQLSASFTIAAYACATDQMWILHTLSLAAFVVAGGSTWIGWRKWRRLDSRNNQGTDEDGRLSGGALLLAALFLIAIVAGELSNWLLEPCI